MYYIIYETTNTMNGKKYIGKHQTENLYDEYLGSGIVLNNAIKKYGKETFKREILFIFDNEKEMLEKEIELITLDVCQSENYYNISLGGQGGCIVLKEGHPKFEETKKKISEKHKEKSEFYRDTAKKNHKSKSIGMYGKQHSEETKKKMSEKAKLIDHWWLREQDYSYLHDRVISDEIKEKISQSHKKRFESQEIRDRHANQCRGENNGMYGKKHSEESRQKMSLKQKDRPRKLHSEETKAKMRRAWELRKLKKC